MDLIVLCYLIKGFLVSFRLYIKLFTYVRNYHSSKFFFFFISYCEIYFTNCKCKGDIIIFPVNLLTRN